MIKHFLFFFSILLLFTSLFANERQITINKGKPVIVDGILEEGEWDDAGKISIEITDRYSITVYFKHDGENLLFAFDGFLPEIFRVPEVMLDIKNDRSPLMDDNDWWFHASMTDCWSNGSFNDWNSCVRNAESWKANNVIDMKAENKFEMEIPFKLINLDLSESNTIGIAFNATDTRSEWNFCPKHAQIALPSSWGEAVINK